MPEKVVVHMDLDAFFASVEQRDNPALQGKPVVVGADPKGGYGRGVAATCSYEARQYGIHSAMPISIAYKRCPHAVFLRGQHSKYRAISKEVFAILNDFTPHIQPVSIDEAFLDITGSYHFYGTPFQTCAEIKKRIVDQVGLNASIGIAPVKFVAKIASDYSKPDGLLEVRPGKVISFLAPLSIKRLWGVGPKMQGRLNRMGIKTIGQLATIPLDTMVRQFGDHGRHLHDLANGIDDREVEVDSEVKSVSHEHTFEKDTEDKESINEVLLSISEKLSRRLRKADLKAKTITVKIRLKGFQTFTRAVTIPLRTNFTDDIYHTADHIFQQFYKPGMEIRLIGVRTSHFVDHYVQDTLFTDGLTEKRERIHEVVDVIKDKYGEDSIHRAL